MDGGGLLTGSSGRSGLLIGSSGGRGLLTGSKGRRGILTGGRQWSAGVADCDPWTADTEQRTTVSAVQQYRSWPHSLHST